MNEADTCRKLVLPRLLAAGWDSEPHSIAEQRTITDGRIVPAGKGFIRKPPRRVDYLLRYTRDFPLAVVEAKPGYKAAADGLQQAKNYAEMLGLKFAYATNGYDIVEFDYARGLEQARSDYPTPDVILTNPPFGGEEEKGIQGNFPEDRQTAETALLFLQLIMRKLRRRPTPVGRPARAAVVVPNGTLFGDGVCARIKKELLEEFNLHTIVRLPNGVFAPYTSIPTNLLFFDRSGPTREVWYYEHPLPEGRKNYTKTVPIQFEEFAACRAWWDKREESERAWKVPAADLLAANCNLDRKNPRAKEDITHLPPEQLAASIMEKERRVLEIVADIQKLLAQGPDR